VPPVVIVPEDDWSIGVVVEVENTGLFTVAMERSADPVMVMLVPPVMILDKYSHDGLAAAPPVINIWSANPGARSDIMPAPEKYVTLPWGTALKFWPVPPHWVPIAVPFQVPDATTPVAVISVRLPVVTTVPDALGRVHTVAPPKAAMVIVPLFTASESKTI